MDVVATVATAVSVLGRGIYIVGVISQSLAVISEYWQTSPLVPVAFIFISNLSHKEDKYINFVRSRCKIFLLFSLLHLHCISGFGGRHDSSEHIEQAAEKRAYSIHRIDTLILLIFVTLLVFIVLTAWFFKHHRLRFIHETGLTLCYGLLIGILLRYTNISVIESQTIDVMQKNRSVVRDPPDYLRLEVEPVKTQNVQFHYELMEATFFRNIGSILMFAFAGTTISAIVIAIIMHSFCWLFSSSFTFKELLLFGALMSSTDPDKVLKQIDLYLDIVTKALSKYASLTARRISVILMCIMRHIIIQGGGLVGAFILGSMCKKKLHYCLIVRYHSELSVLAVFQEMEVESDLYALVFGESVLNDAVAIVLASSVDNFASNEAFDLDALFAAIVNFLSVFLASSLLLGSVIGCATALITKMTEIKEFPLLESALFILLSYLSFLLAEFVELTGIVAVLFCAICQAHYTYNNLSDEARTRTKQFLSKRFRITQSTVEYFLFLCTLLSLFLSRAAHIYPVSAMLNIRRKPKIPQRYQHMMLFAGLRGAIAFALAYRNTSTDNRQIMATTTSMVVIVTVLFNGGLTSWFTEYLGIRHGVAARDDSQLQLSMDDMHLQGMDELSRVSGQNPWDKAFLPRKWYNFDASFMKPFLTNANPTLLETMPSFMTPFAKIFTTKQQLTMYTRTINNGSVSSQTTSNENPFLRVRYYNSVDKLAMNNSLSEF
ncbi:Sodium/hydrogen exchanger [Dirofilaria immitis]|nr:Sodium/hydrogen exchanger [Dirofilaria immitis]